MHIPATVACQQCGRTLPVRAQMQFDGKTLPMLAVLVDVDSVEEAIAQATCQVCLKKSGPTDRSLHEVLKRLGLKDEEDDAPPPREAAVVVHVREERTVPTRGVVVSDARPREVVMVDPLMGTSIEVTHHQPPARDQRPRAPRREERPTPRSDLSLPRALRVPERREPPAPVEHLTGAIGASGRNKRVLEAAAVVALEREATRKRERIEKFMRILFWLGLTLARIRKNAVKSEVWVLVEAFERKLGEAISLDPHSRGKRGLLAQLGSSIDELEALCHEFYLGKEPLLLRHPIEVVTMDAFEGGRRPQAWDEKGGRKPAFYQVEVVRTKSRLPVPNLPLPSGDDEPRPRIVYPDGGGYGPDYTVENSRRGTRRKFDWELKPFGWAILSLASWLGDHLDLEVKGLNLCDLVCSFIESTFVEEEDEPSTIDLVAAATEPTTTTLELPATI